VTSLGSGLSAEGRNVTSTMKQNLVATLCPARADEEDGLSGRTGKTDVL